MCIFLNSFLRLYVRFTHIPQTKKIAEFSEMHIKKDIYKVALLDIEKYTNSFYWKQSIDIGSKVTFLIS